MECSKLSESLLSQHHEDENNFQIIDYTLATPFEVLVNQLEKLLEQDINFDICLKWQLSQTKEQLKEDVQQRSSLSNTQIIQKIQSNYEQINDSLKIKTDNFLYGEDNYLIQYCCYKYIDQLSLDPPLMSQKIDIRFLCNQQIELLNVQNQFPKQKVQKLFRVFGITEFIHILKNGSRKKIDDGTFKVKTKDQILNEKSQLNLLLSAIHQAVQNQRVRIPVFVEFEDETLGILSNICFTTQFTQKTIIKQDISQSFNSGLIDQIKAKYNIPNNHSIYNMHTYCLTSFLSKDKFFDDNDPVDYISLRLKYNNIDQKELNCSQSIDTFLDIILHQQEEFQLKYDTNKIFNQKAKQVKEEQKIKYSQLTKINNTFMYYQHQLKIPSLNVITNKLTQYTTDYEQSLKQLMLDLRDIWENNIQSNLYIDWIHEQCNNIEDQTLPDQLLLSIVLCLYLKQQMKYYQFHNEYLDQQNEQQLTPGQLKGLIQEEVKNEEINQDEIELQVEETQETDNLNQDDDLFQEPEEDLFQLYSKFSLDKYKVNRHFQIFTIWNIIDDWQYNELKQIQQNISKDQFIENFLSKNIKFMYMIFKTEISSQRQDFIRWFKSELNCNYRFGQIYNSLSSNMILNIISSINEKNEEQLYCEFFNKIEMKFETNMINLETMINTDLPLKLQIRKQFIKLQSVLKYLAEIQRYDYEEYLQYSVQEFFQTFQISYHQISKIQRYFENFILEISLLYKNKSLPLRLLNTFIKNHQIEIQDEQDKQICEDFFNTSDKKNHVQLRMPYQSEFIIRYKGKGKSDINRVYICSKIRSIRICSAIMIENLNY